jgi:biopolymer transport protein ExbB/TolQ
LSEGSAITASPLHIFISADWLVQSIIILLLLASIASWALIINRGWAIRRELRYVRNARRTLTSVGTRDQLHQLIDQEKGQIVPILSAIEAEWRWSSENPQQSYDQARDRILSVAEMTVAREGRRLAGRTGWLATIGSTAPFIGLFGTVWGIMRSFLAIGMSQDTSLAVVAPGIAEALLATAIGLFCAIPAVIGFNRLQQGIAEVDAEWRSTGGLLEVAISRHFSTRSRP